VHFIDEDQVAKKAYISEPVSSPAYPFNGKEITTSPIKDGHRSDSLPTWGGKYF